MTISDPLVVGSVGGVTQDYLAIEMKIANMNYTELIKNATLFAEFKSQIVAELQSSVMKNIETY